MSAYYALYYDILCASAFRVDAVACRLQQSSRKLDRYEDSKAEDAEHLCRKLRRLRA